MIEQNGSHSISGKIQMLIEKARVLYNKGLLNECKGIIEESKIIAEKYELYTPQLELGNLELNLINRLNKRDVEPYNKVFTRRGGIYNPFRKIITYFDHQ